MAEHLSSQVSGRINAPCLCNLLWTTGQWQWLIAVQFAASYCEQADRSHIAYKSPTIMVLPVSETFPARNRPRSFL